MVSAEQRCFSALQVPSVSIRLDSWILVPATVRAGAAVAVVEEQCMAMLTAEVVRVRCSRLEHSCDSLHLPMLEPQQTSVLDCWRWTQSGCNLEDLSNTAAVEELASATAHD